ncbi:MAG: cytochrome c peroxidase [Bdellovibrionota bacterium]
MSAACGGDGPVPLNSKEELGKRLFFDTALSNPPGQSCGTCHSSARAFTDPDSVRVPTSHGAVPERFGFRNTPSLNYVAFNPLFHFSEEEEDFIGGLFWDGQAATLEDQAKRPFLRSIEMNNESPEQVISKVRQADYATMFRNVFGNDALDSPDSALERVAEAIAAFERSNDFGRFSSKYDAFLRGDATLSSEEREGLALFNDPAKGNCAACHPSAPSDGKPPLFTDFTYDNIGVPRNPNNPFYRESAAINPEGETFTDRGLENSSGRTSDAGRFKVMTLRNIAVTAPYFHNGAMGTLEDVVHFYNARDVERVVPEIAEGVNKDELGNLGLTLSEEAKIVTFLKTLTDGYSAEKEEIGN